MSARVLVVDDVPANVKLLEARLSAEYFDVVSVTNGPEALGIYIISMTNEVSDVLEVLHLHRLAGVSLPVAPLFETLAVLGRETCLHRIGRAIQQLERDAKPAEKSS